jgi:hypothetical protein
MGFTCDIVISYYKEDLSWLDEFKHLPFRHIYLYNKGTGSPKAPVQYIEEKLENIGRCDHTYLYHIINHWSDLADVTIFCTGSTSLEHKMKKFRNIVKKVFETETSVFYGVFYPSVKNAMYTFYMRGHRSTYKNNQEAGHKDVLAPSKIRPFGPWYEAHFPHIRTTHIPYYGLFAVARKHIKQHPIDHYKKLIAEFPHHSNPEVGHYFERAWTAVFHPIPKDSLYCERDGHRGRTRKVTAK